MLNWSSLTKIIFTHVYLYLYEETFLRKGRHVCVSNSNLMVLRLFHICVCALNS